MKIISLSIREVVFIVLLILGVVLLVGCGHTSSMTNSIQHQTVIANAQHKPKDADMPLGKIFSSKQISYPDSPDVDYMDTSTNSTLAGGAQRSGGTQAQTALVLYDTTGTYGWLGKLYVIELKNLLSHFPLQLTSKAVEKYKSGDMNNYDVTFYLGALYNNPLPAAFEADVMASTKTICWIGYNLWDVAWTTSGTTTSWNPAFAAKFGFNFLGIDGSGYPNVLYKGVTLTKDQSDPNIGAIAVANPAIAQVVATCSNAAGTTLPYITHGANLWYISDTPFSYVSYTDRYLAFADVLHDVIGDNVQESHHAFIRIEDVSPMSDPNDLINIANYLYSQNVPFAVATIPEYHDPLGVYNLGVPLIVDMVKNSAYVQALQYMVAHGGSISQHGYTHQYSNVVNPFSGVSGEDFEFYRVTLDSNSNLNFIGPIPGDSQAWALTRVQTGKALLDAQKLSPKSWTMVQYLGSPVDYKGIRQVFKNTLDSGVYFATGSDGTVYFEEQFAPYILEKDRFGFRKIPETLGYVDPNEGTEGGVLPADMLNRAACDKVVRDGFASGFFHWFLDVSYLQTLVSGLKAQGYQFVSIDQAANM